ncbi:MAG: hypothetical protein ACXWNK_00885 [Vulcanimicrobiaceae bacterium]
MDIVALIAERKIEEAMGNGAFDALAPMGRIDCSLHGERFIAKWFREKFQREELEVDLQIKKPGS